MKNNEIVESPYYYDDKEPYKISLKIETNPDSGGEYLKIYFLIWYDEKSEGLKWPFTRNVCIQLFNGSGCKVQFQNIEIEKPQNNSCRYSNPFIFKHFTFPNSTNQKSSYLIICSF